MTSVKLPLWLRFVLIAGVAVLASGAGFFAYRSPRDYREVRGLLPGSEPQATSLWRRGKSRGGPRTTKKLGQGDDPPLHLAVMDNAAIVVLNAAAADSMLTELRFDQRERLKKRTPR